MHEPFGIRAGPVNGECTARLAVRLEALIPRPLGLSVESVFPSELPAHRIVGEANAEQLLVALEQYGLGSAESFEMLISLYDGRP